MELNRRETQRAIIARHHQFTTTDAFAQAVLMTLTVRLSMMEEAYRQYHREHLLVVENNVQPGDMDEQNAAVATVDEMYIEALTEFRLRIEDLQPPLVEPPVQRDNGNDERQLLTFRRVNQPVNLERI